MLEWGDRRGGEGLGAERTPLALGGARAVDGERVSLEVLNGAGDPGAAERVSERLRDLGFDVKTFGNARSYDQAATEVIDRSERQGAAEAISEALGGVPVRVDPAPQLYLDATLMLGDDWRQVLERMER
jgi:hypothetical protein